MIDRLSDSMAVNEHTLVLLKTDTRRKLAKSERLETSGNQSNMHVFMLKCFLKSHNVQSMTYWCMTGVIIDD